MNWKNRKQIFLQRVQMLAISAAFDAAIMAIIIIWW
jgi:hypothetical protein